MYAMHSGTQKCILAGMVTNAPAYKETNPGSELSPQPGLGSLASSALTLQCMLVLLHIMLLQYRVGHACSELAACCAEASMLDGLH